MMPTDEDLARIARDVQRDYLRAHDGGAWHPDNDDEMWEQIARAVRAALCPPVTPLAPGDSIEIADVDDDLYRIRTEVSGNLLRLSFMIGSEEDDNRSLDAAGIAALETACRRARAALEGDA